MALAAVSAPPSASSTSSPPPRARFSNVFGDAMVLQRDQPIRLWGFGFGASAACLGSACGPAVATPRGGSNAPGWWAATLPARAASATAVELTLRDANNITLQRLVDVVVGDVYLFSGQSNIYIPQTYGSQVYDPGLPDCRPQDATNRLCSRTNTTAQRATEALADRLGESLGLVRLRIVAAPAPNATVDAEAPELPEAPDCELCHPPATPYVLGGR